MRAFPADARFKNLKGKYADLIGDLDEAIEKTNTINELNKALEQITYPDETILVLMQREDANSRDHKYALDSAIINKLQPENRNGSNYTRTEVLNGSGYGQNNNQYFYIWRHALKKYGYDYIEIRLERELHDLVVAQ